MSTPLEAIPPIELTLDDPFDTGGLADNEDDAPPETIHNRLLQTNEYTSGLLTVPFYQSHTSDAKLIHFHGHVVLGASPKDELLVLLKMRGEEATGTLYDWARLVLSSSV